MQRIEEFNDWLNGLGESTTFVNFPQLLVLALVTMVLGQVLAWH